MRADAGAGEPAATEEFGMETQELHRGRLIDHIQPAACTA